MKMLDKTSLSLIVSAIASCVLVSAGCQQQPTYSQARPDVSAYAPGDTGLQSRDLVDMTDQLTADLLKIPEISQNPTQVIIVMSSLQNQTSQPWQNNQIYLARMRALLNQYARDRLTFVLPPGQLQQLQQQNLSGNNNDAFEQSSRAAAPAPSATLVPQYALTGTFYDQPNTSTTYYLCTFQLVNLQTGAITWEGHYEVRTLNFGG
jgi:PBP1b-binding outer membrane lipoprotein LpoB